MYEALASLRPRKSFVRQPVNNRVHAAKQHICVVAKLRGLRDYGPWSTSDTGRIHQSLQLSMVLLLGSLRFPTDTHGFLCIKSLGSAQGLPMEPSNRIHVRKKFELASSLLSDKVTTWLSASFELP
jgi:hypothetical protein